MTLYHFWVFAFGAFALGCVIASFLNVCIWRIPRGESVVSPPSHCPNCNARIRWYQNIPVLSWLALRGKCASCKTRISPRYILIELLGGILFLAAYFQAAVPLFFGETPPLGIAPMPVAYLPVWFVAYAGLILATFIDLEHFWIPDRVTIGGMVVGIPLNFAAVFGTWRLLFDKPFPFAGALQEALFTYGAGLAFGFGSLWLLRFVFSKILKREAMGFGDVKLMGAVGAFFGPWAVLFVMIASSVAGSVVGIGMILLGKAKIGGFREIPYGPFIAFGTVLWMIWGETLLYWYLSGIR